MIIIGHPLLDSERFQAVSDVAEVAQSAPNSVVWFLFPDDSVLPGYCRENRVPFAVECRDARELLIAYNWRAKYILCQEAQAAEFQKIAETYLFDSKILMIIEKEQGIEVALRLEVDGVVLSNHLLRK